MTDPTQKDVVSLQEALKKNFEAETDVNTLRKKIFASCNYVPEKGQIEEEAYEELKNRMGGSFITKEAVEFYETIKLDMKELSKRPALQVNEKGDTI